MTLSRLFNPVSWALALLLTLVLVGCGGGDSGLSRAEVEEIVREEMAATPEAGPAITADDVEEAVRRAMDEPGLSRDDVERIARSVVASIPSRSAQPEYTKFFVQNAVSRYETQGLDATLAYYSSEESIDGQWYVFIIDEDDILIAHPDTSRVGMDVKGWIGTDGYGYNYGPEMLSATGDGKWVSYVFLNPENGSIAAGNFESLELKNVWVVDTTVFSSPPAGTSAPRSSRGGLCPSPSTRSAKADSRRPWRTSPRPRARWRASRTQ